jgi:sRNA-binding regulator protein Hfq
MKTAPTTISLLLSFLLTLAPLAHGQQLNNEAAEATTVKTEANRRLDKNENRVKIKLRNGSEVKGRITQTAENSFTLTDEKTDRYQLYRCSETEWQGVEQED